ncbi:hypothetical protein DICPUDRAFT_80001 [Dictyostelium purpureum]|uniref:Uncharacterized protein n=1 Tax=Dictyostelium purpureum TaxID=5786 RepID=F0ZP88_DICPU|nr:uncharacterized protein DICPUDRAFT_80001 [Dictyostelium purpureum]EGC34263.1 hypothetical protein DICPUDRAFT_80001 [Dictyostelium purpureum]|eukprot:XP_003289232.1 hypothetical protein DICPUDRAFT_80001 [Dictyostelium purpureum]
MSLITRKSIFSTISYITRAAADKKGAAAGGKKKPGAGAKKKRFDRGNEPLVLEKISTVVFKTPLPTEKDEFPAWLFEIEDQLPRDKKVRLLLPEDGARYYKQQARSGIKTHNQIMALTKGRGL